MGSIIRLAPGGAGRLVALVVALSISLPLPAVTHAGVQTVGAADVHMYTDTNDLEVNVFLSQTQSWCGAPLNGQTCLRYTVAQNDSPVFAGYGLIPSSDLAVTGSSITLNIDTSTLPNFTTVFGSTGKVSIVWKANPGASAVVAGKRTETLSPCTVTGNILGYTIDQSAQLNGDTLIYTG